MLFIGGRLHDHRIRLSASPLAFEQNCDPDQTIDALIREAACCAGLPPMADGIHRCVPMIHVGELVA